MPIPGLKINKRDIKVGAMFVVPVASHGAVAAAVSSAAAAAQTSGQTILMSGGSAGLMSGGSAGLMSGGSAGALAAALLAPAQAAPAQAPPAPPAQAAPGEAASSDASAQAGGKAPEPGVVRPEILLLTQFKPLYNISNKMTLTPEGEIFYNFVSKLQLNESQANQLIDKELIKKNNENFKFQISLLRNNIVTVYDFVKNISNAKKTFNVSDSSYNFKVGQFIEKNFDSMAIPVTKTYPSVDLNQEYNLKKCLLTARPDSSVIITSFASSKLFLVALQELKCLMFGYPYNQIILEAPLAVGSQSDNFYKLPDLNPTKRIHIVDRFAASVGVDFTSAGDDRFRKIQTVIDGELTSADPKVISSLLFYTCFRDLIQKTRFELNGIPSLLNDRIEYFNSFIGNYATNKRFYDAATDLTNPYSGDKLSDIVYFGSLNDPTKKVLMLEDSPPANLSNKDVNISGDYLFLTGDFQKGLSSSALGLDRVKDFNKFLNKMTDMSFKNFIDLGVLPPADSYISSLGKPYSTLDPLTAFKELQGPLLEALTDGYGSINFVPTSDGTWTIDVSGNHFTDLDLIALFCHEQKVLIPGTGVSGVPSAYVSFGDQMSNWIYNYVYSEASGQKSVTEDNVGKYITNLFIASKSILNALGTNVTITDKKIFTDTSLWPAAIAKQIKDSKFISVLVTFFKKYIDLHGLLPALLFSVRLLIKKINRITIKRFYATKTHSYMLVDYSNLISGWTASKVDFMAGNAAVTINPQLTNIKATYSKMLDGVATNIDLHSQKSLILTLGVLNTIQTLRNNVGLVLNLMQSLDDDVIDYFLRYVSKEQLSVLFNEENQLLLMLSTIEDTYRSYDGFSTEGADKSQLFVKREDNLSHSTKIVNILEDFFKTGDEYTAIKAYNKQIMSVGIPRGLLANFDNLLKSNNRKNNDIFKILIYKINLLKPDIIYKPQSFLFEASRFPVRVYSELPVDRINTSEKIQTRNYSSYLGKVGTNVANSFDSEYNNLSPALTLRDREAILFNQRKSFMLENYLKIISGFNVSELTFNDTSISQLFLLDPLESERKQTKAEKAIPNPDFYISKLLRPKKFDRVFNIIFDPDNFIVDLVSMGTTAKIFADSIHASDFTTLNNNTYYDVAKDATATEFNSYFVSIESHATYDDGMDMQLYNDPYMKAVYTNVVLPNFNGPLDKI